MKYRVFINNVFNVFVLQEKLKKKAYSDPQKKHLAEIEEKLEQLLELEAEASISLHTEF